MMTVERAIELKQVYERKFNDDSAVYTRVALESIYSIASSDGSVSLAQVQRIMDLRERGLVSAETKYRDSVMSLEAEVGMSMHKWKTAR